MVLKNKKAAKNTQEGKQKANCRVTGFEPQDYGFLPLFFYVSDLSEVSSMSITFILGDKNRNLK